MRSLPFRIRFLGIGLVAAFYLLVSFSDFHIRNKQVERESSDLLESSTESNANKTIVWCQQPLHYRSDPEGKPVVALVSYPGSGNTWLRYLLQQATGLHTGSVYADPMLKKAGFAESVANSSVVVVKTHGLSEEERKPFDRAVLLVRSPFDTILTSFNHKFSSLKHVGLAPMYKFTEDNGEVWKKFAYRHLPWWRHTNMNWLNDFHGPLHVVLYEDLVNNLEPTLRALLNFLEISVSEDTMRCVLEQREGSFHRESRPLPMDPFTDEMRTRIEAVQAEVYGKIESLRAEKVAV